MTWRNASLTSRMRPVSTSVTVRMAGEISNAARSRSLAPRSLMEGESTPLAPLGTASWIRSPRLRLRLAPLAPLGTASWIRSPRLRLRLALLFFFDLPHLADAFGEAVRVGGEEARELVALLERDGGLQLVHRGLELGIGHRRAQPVPELGQHGLRRALGREDARPDVELRLRIPEFLERGHVRQRGDPRLAPAREGT